MAFAALRELSHDAGGMGRTMAVLAFGHHFMLFLMARCARQGRMLDLAGAEKVKDLAMARSAVL